jgi:hypothetical protein
MIFVSDFLAVLMDLLQVSVENMQIKAAISYYAHELSPGFEANLFLLSTEYTFLKF